MGISISYEVESLEEISAHFDEMAERAAVTASHAKTQRSRAVNNAESRTWTRAAEMLRETTMKG